MKHSYSAQLFALSGISFLLALTSACKKNAPTPDANTSLLASHSWRLLTFADTDNTAKPPATTYHTFSSYRLDDTYQFNTDNGLVFDDGSRRASPTDSQIATGNWQFQTNQGNQAGLVITLPRAVTLGTTGISSTTAYDLLKLSTDTLRLRTGNQYEYVVITLVK